MSVSVTIQSHANLDFAEIVNWLSKSSVDGANRWIDAFDAALTAIAQSPFEHPLAPEDEFIEIGVRQVLFHTKRGRRYRILYTVANDQVRVLRVRGPGQNLLTRDELNS